MNDNGWPDWADDFLENLLRYSDPDGKVNVLRASHLTGIAPKTAYATRNRHDSFRIRWDQIRLTVLQNHLKNAG